MKIEIAEAGGKKRTLHIPLFKSMAGIVAWAMENNKKNFIGYVNDEKDEEDIKVGIGATEEQFVNLPSKKEIKAFFAEAIGILKGYKGLVLVEVDDHEGDYVKIIL